MFKGRAQLTNWARDQFRIMSNTASDIRGLTNKMAGRPDPKSLGLSWGIFHKKNVLY